MRRTLLFVMAVSAFRIVAAAEPTVSEMDALNKASKARNSAYEMEAVSAFFGDGVFMQKCAPAGAPLPKPFDVYFEVLPDGALGRTLFAPLTEMAKCVKEATSSRSFLKPPQPGSYVAKINMRFK